MIGWPLSAHLPVPLCKNGCPNVWSNSNQHLNAKTSWPCQVLSFFREEHRVSRGRLALVPHGIYSDNAATACRQILQPTGAQLGYLFIVASCHQLLLFQLLLLVSVRLPFVSGGDCSFSQDLPAAPACLHIGLRWSGSLSLYLPSEIYLKSCFRSDVYCLELGNC